MRQLFLIVGLLLTAVACQRLPNDSPNFSAECPPDTPPLNAIAQTMAACLPSDGADEAARAYLRDWGRIEERIEDSWYWGGVQTAASQPGASDLLIMAYYADLTEVNWNPQGKLAVLQQTADGWRVLFESPQPSATRLDGAHTLDGNWSYHLTAVGDATGDGRDDFLIEQRWSNMTHGYANFAKLMRVNPDEAESVRFIFLEDGSRTRPRYRIADQGIHATILVHGQEAITRTFQLAGQNFVQVDETINPEAAILSAVTPDGAGWYAYDETRSLGGSPTFGLYRLQDGRLGHYDLPLAITSLRLLADGRLYAGGVDGEAPVIWRLEGEEWVAVLGRDFARPETSQFRMPLAMALDDAGHLWVAGVFVLLQLGPEEAAVYEINAFDLLIAPDQTVWAAGWDGLADSDCCYYTVRDGVATSYHRAEPLPVDAELEQQIRAMTP
jgi:hypothetical protein